MKRSTITGLVAGLALSIFAVGSVRSQAYTENFDNITLLAGNGWSLQNVSTPVGATGWSQGPDMAGGGPFNSYNGATNAFISANFNNTGSTGTISNWLVTPNRTLRNGDVFTFYTRKASPDSYADRLEVRLSTNGASTNVGSGATTGDFSTLLLSINPSLVLGVYPTTWTQYTITVSGLPAPTSGRIAFRYFVTGGGSLGANSDFIGIDAVNYTPYVCPSFTMTAGGALTAGTAGSAYSTTLSQTGALGAPNFAVTAGALPPGLTMAANGTISGTPTATGTFNFTSTVSDASGCSGTQSYSITVVCPANPTSLNGLPSLCSNAAPYVLTQGSPAGGTYSGTGVTGASFDPAAGTQTITYNYTDPYGCAFSTNNTITVNTAPTVTLGSFTAVCSNNGSITLGGESPAGGTFSGTNVSGGMFDPSGGTQSVTYSYTDGNGCSNTASQTFTVNTAPTPTLGAFTPVCSNGGSVTLNGESPAGGTFSGTGVSGGMFDPSVGTQTITYSYTDGNGCTGTITQPFNVNIAPTVTQDPIADVCQNGSPITLTGGLPAGGTYSGTGVSGGMFDPSVGTQTITYSYTDANSCTNTASTSITVTAATNASLSSFTPACSNNSPVTLSGGSPAGGTYSGTGVTGGMFDPSVGTQTITYTVYVGTPCESSTTGVFTVNTAPSVALTLTVTDLCIYNSAVALAGGTPASGSYSGNGVSGSSFNPASAGLGNSTITYTYTDGNGCSGSATDIINVDDCAGINETDAVVVAVAPNPSTGNFMVSVKDVSLLTNLSVIDLSGKTVQNNVELVDATSVSVTIADKNTGVYILTGEYNNQPFSIRLVKQ